MKQNEIMQKKENSIGKIWKEFHRKMRKSTK